MTWTKDLMTSLDVFNVSSSLNLTNQHLTNITRKVQSDLVKMNLLPNVTLPELQQVLDIFNLTNLDPFNLTKLDLFNMTNMDPFNITKLDIFNLTSLDLFNATRLRVEQTLNENPILGHLKNFAKNSTKTEETSGNGNNSSEESADDDSTTTPVPPNFLIERIKELQNIQNGIGSSLKSILNPHNPPFKMKDLKLAMAVIPKLVPYVLEANTPKLKTFLKVGTRFTLNELYQIHNSLTDLHRFVAKTRDNFVREKSPTLTTMSDMIIDKNIKLMRTILVLMVKADRSDKSDKSFLLSQEDIEQLQEYLVSPSDIYSILVRQN